MKAGGVAGPIDHGRFQVIEDDGARTGPKRLQGMDDLAIEFRLAPPECELDIGHPAVAKHGHEDRNPAVRASYLNAAALAPIDLHGLGWLVVNFLIDATARGPDGPNVAADGNHAAGVAIGAASNFLLDAHR